MSTPIICSTGLLLASILAVSAVDHGDYDDPGHGTGDGPDDHSGGAMSQGNLLQAFLACATVHLVTLAVVVVIAQGPVREKLTYVLSRHARAFAAGTILTTATMVMLSQAYFLVQEELRNETEVIVAFAVPAVSGIFVLVLLDTFLTGAFGYAKYRQRRKLSRSWSSDLADRTAAASDTSKATAPSPGLKFNKSSAGGAEDSAIVATRVMIAVGVGDVLQMFANGAFIAVAFLTCSPSVGWGIVLGTLTYELSQEVADFVILTSVAQVRVLFAVLAQFISGAAIYAGCGVVVAFPLSPAFLGGLLAFGAGIYIYTSCVETVPSMLHTKDFREKAVAVLLFAVGALLIMTVILNNDHCSVGAGPGDDHHDHHADHEHRLL